MAEASLLLNAEPFGFGPASAAASFAALLRPRVRRMGYAGVGHTLDLQAGVGYDAVHDLTGADAAAWAEVLRGYDVLLTALDDGVAAMALDAGLRVVFYDPLAWYWPTLPSTAGRCVYLAQDFFGVAERIRRDADQFGDVRTVPPITTPPAAAPGVRRDDGLALLNLGGLQNPLWTPEPVVAYARAVVAAAREALPAGTRIEVAASGRISRAVGGDGARPRGQAEMADLFARSRFALMTPGLGNVYDAAAHGLPTVWLPPANDSQGQQLLTLAEAGMADASADWSVLGRPVDYRRPQPAVMADIGRAIGWLGTAEGAERLRSAVAAGVAAVAAGGPPRAAALVDRFGSGGAARVADIVSDLLHRELPRAA